MLEKDAILAKISNVKKCLRAIESATGLQPVALDDWIKQDVFVLNLQRATQSTIDMANLVISDQGWELPRSYRHAFRILEENGVVDGKAAEAMGRMAGFRNLAIHDYVSLDPNILKKLLTEHLRDFEYFYSQVFRHYQ